MALIQGGSSTSNIANVSSTFELAVKTTTTPANAGLIGNAALMDDGASRSDSVNTAYARRLFSSISNRLLVGQDNWLFSETFMAAASNSAIWRNSSTTQTVAQTTGILTLNNSAITTINTNSAAQTYRTFPLFASGEIRCEVTARLSKVQTNQLAEFGLFNATIPGAAAPTDGIFFRYNASGELRGIVTYNGTENTTVALTVPTENQFHKYKVSIDHRFAEFWVDDTLRATIDLFSVAPLQSLSVLSIAPPFTARYVIAGTPPGVAATLGISQVNVWAVDGSWAKPWSEQLAGMGQGAYQGVQGQTMGSTQNYANSANPGPAVPTNTTAALGSGLGGQFWETDTLAVTTDGVISSYQNPAYTLAIQGRNLFITGVTIWSSVQTALTAGGYVAHWSLAFGHNTVSLASAESITAATKAPRRVAIGMQAVPGGAPALTILNSLTYKFTTPILVQPGEFIQTVKKKVGTAPTAGTIAHQITFDGYQE